MTKRFLTVAAAAALLVPAIAMAEVQAVDGEAGMIFTDPVSTVTRDQVRAEMKSGAAGEVHFKFVGGEAGWIHESPSHRMAVDNGQLVHASDCPVMASLQAAKSQRAIDAGFYTGA